MTAQAVKKTRDSGARAPFAAFATDEVTRATLTRIADKRGWAKAPVVGGGVATAVETLADQPTPSLIVVDLSNAADPLAEMKRLALVCEPGTRVIALGTVNDVALYKGLLALGVDEYLLKPTAPAALEAALARSELPPPAPETGKPGRFVVVVGARGGVGATTVAVNMAWMQAEEEGRRTALADLDLHFGTVALALDMEPGRGLREALQSPARIDGLFVERAMVRASEHLSVLATEGALDADASLDVDALDLLVEKLRDGFEVVVADVPRTVAVAQPGLLAAADAVLVVADLSLAGMRDAARLAEWAAAEGAAERVKIVANRVGAAGKGELSPADFERNGELRIASAIPLDPKPAAKSAASGRPLAAVAPASRAVKELRVLMRNVVAPPEKPTRRGWRRWLGGRG